MVVHELRSSITIWVTLGQIWVAPSTHGSFEKSALLLIMGGFLLFFVDGYHG